MRALFRAAPPPPHLDASLAPAFTTAGAPPGALPATSPPCTVARGGDGPVASVARLEPPVFLIPVGEGPAAVGAPANARALLVRHPLGWPGKRFGCGGRKQRAARAFAVISFAGSQFKVTLDDVVTVSTTVDADVGETVHLDDVLLVGSATETVVGRPLVPGARVTLAVEEKKKEKKVIIFKKRRRKGYQRKNGFRRQVTALRVMDISY